MGHLQDLLPQEGSVGDQGQQELLGRAPVLLGVRVLWEALHEHSILAAKTSTPTSTTSLQNKI